jgi:hypothetical protein
MKTLLTILLSILTVTLMAQVPQGVGYQGVATDSEGIELVNQSISIRASVLSGTANGTIEWEETHATTTDTFGLFTLTIGQGTNTTNGVQTSFADISWGTNTHFLKIEMDVTGGTNYSFMGTNQMMSVPYALYAESANINYDSIANYLSGDSTFVTNISNGLGGGSGCDFAFPDGRNGEPVVIDLLSGNYTVPSGKNFYIINPFRMNADYFLLINGVKVLNIVTNTDYQVAPIPYIVKSGDIISYYAPSGTVDDAVLSGLLLDAVIDPVVIDLLSGNYTVPIGKNFYIIHPFRMNADYFLLINGVKVMNVVTNTDYQVAPIPYIVKSGDIISYYAPSGTVDDAILSGYLADENYFDGCGEPENPSSIGSNPNSLIYTIDGF